MNAYVYIRQSTKKQERSGLSVCAQRKACTDYANNKGYVILGEEVETASGANDERIKLNKLMVLAKRNNAIVLVSTLDRLSRKVSFIAKLMDKGVRFVCADLGDEVPNFMLHMFASYAELERKKISDRTRAALQAKKKNGAKLGNPRWQESIANARESRFKGRDKWVSSMKKVIKSIVIADHVCYNRVAFELNQMGIPSYRGGVWYAQSVKRVWEHTQ
jgi:DNA invertase Pin-like site-specific DNA recombinase